MTHTPMHKTTAARRYGRASAAVPMSHAFLSEHNPRLALPHMTCPQEAS